MALNFKKASARRDAQPKVPRGYRVYAIGDVHGRLDLLNEILARIESENAARGKARTAIVFLGDLIDRGPASSQVLERVRTYQHPGVRTVCLTGNHEEVLLRLLRGESGLLRDWLKFGGAECLQSYGIDPIELNRMPPILAVSRLRERIPSAHRSFLEGLADTFRIGSYLFVHAGVRPGIGLMEQSQADLRWIRDPFLEDANDHGFVVVHGHTIHSEVDIRPNRIGLDTGAYRTGVLTAMGLEGSERWFLQTG
jgi:serine/threonine protein phosphatase 1